MNFFIVLILTILTNCIYYSLSAPVDLQDPWISKSIECADDVKLLCKDQKLNTDVAILTCLQDSEEVMQQISPNCQHILWNYKHNLTKSDFFDKMTTKQCSTDLLAISECKDAAIGMKAPCLLDHKDKVTVEQCSKFLNDIGIVIFSDYHLIYKFTNSCSADIRKFKCGRITKPGEKSVVDDDIDSEKPLSETKQSFAEYVTSQSLTLDCLIDNIQDIGMTCQHQILRLSELQSNDYNLNRGLYLACRDDREKLCSKVKSGDGRVYSCLMKEKFNNKMSEKCRNELTRKQQVESLDYKANFPLFTHCKEDIAAHKCLRDVSGINHDIVLMSVILTCLHDAEINGQSLKPNCQSEITDRKAEMLEDLKISPEALTACKQDITDNCQKVENEAGEVVHCLMKLAKPDSKHKKGRLSENCHNGLFTMIKVANPTGNLMQGDVAVRKACSTSYAALCSAVQSPKESFQCLINNLNSAQMTQDCRDKITSLLYFISLDITIDDQLHMACHKDALRLCKEPSSFEETQKSPLIDRQMEYHCMYDHFRQDKINLELAQDQGIPVSQVKLSLSAECSNRMFNLIKAQASKIEVDPIVFVPCFEDLAKYCDGPENREKEHECLQTNIKKLTTNCKKAVIEFSKLESVDSRFNRMLSDACLPMVQKFCSQEKPEHVLQCLSEHKFQPQMSEACHAAIEHIQITSLEEYRIDHRFASFCRLEINEHCQEELNSESDTGDKDKTDRNNRIISKASIVSCLSRVIIEKLMKGDKHPLSDHCRRQFTFELLQRSESIKLDPALVKDCGEDIKRFCTKVESKHINSCLRENQDQLSKNCHRRLFKRERLESLDADFDGELQKTCSEMIHEHCHNEPGNKLFRCLHRNMKSDGFDSDCKQLILTRLERRMNDIRLNPGLVNVCKDDISKYCHNLDVNTPEQGSIEHEGKIILCLRNQFANSTQSLSRDCRERVREIVIESNTNIRLDPNLRRRCSKDMHALCKEEMVTQYEDTVRSVQNCLKYKFLHNMLTESGCKFEVSRLLREGRADVHVDRELFEACDKSIMKLCRGEEFGDGRKMSCLLALIENPKALKLMETGCVAKIRDRQQMWLLSGIYEPQSLKELYVHTMRSSMRVYLLSMIGLIVAALVLIGICCGRVTKRVAVDLKNK